MLELVDLVSKIDRPNKEQIREWFNQRRLNPGPINCEQIRLQLGWKLPSDLLIRCLDVAHTNDTCA